MRAHEQQPDQACAAREGVSQVPPGQPVREEHPVTDVSGCLERSGHGQYAEDIRGFVPPRPEDDVDQRWGERHREREDGDDGLQQCRLTSREEVRELSRLVS